MSAETGREGEGVRGGGEGRREVEEEGEGQGGAETRPALVSATLRLAL